jgi:hypothetical protein
MMCAEGFKQCMVGTIALYDGAGERLKTFGTQTVLTLRARL